MRHPLQLSEETRANRVADMILQASRALAALPILVALGVVLSAFVNGG